MWRRVRDSYKALKGRLTGIPEYSLRTSRRARGVHFEVSPWKGLVVVVPEGFPLGRIPALIRDKRAWIERAFQRLSGQLGTREAASTCELPHLIPLRAIGEDWTVQRRPTEAPWVAAGERGDSCLLLLGNTGDNGACARALHRWINRKSHEHLVPLLQEISLQQGLPFGRALVKSQRTRWGSCSRHKTISINQNLLFVPGHLVRYVFIHELCHTVHLDHSRTFWALVREKAPEYATLRRELRQARQWIPAWVQLLQDQ